jgi:hypothetical protein
MRADLRRRLKGASKAAARPHRVTRYALYFALLAREEAYQQVGLMEGPGPQHNAFAVVRYHSTFCHPTILATTENARPEGRAFASY